MENTATIAPSARSLKFRLIGSPADFMAGDDRSYDVFYRGQHIGEVGNDYVPTSIEGEPARGFSYAGIDGRTGMGRTRAAAVLDAYVVSHGDGAQ